MLKNPCYFFHIVMTLVNQRKILAISLLNIESKEKWKEKGRREEGKDRKRKGRTKDVICGCRRQN